ncbi:hypothetical protein B0H10DRAFT_577049 [Mycena sp. CBHHK59/15]|nr:hypothetical protein B0H10DRAFT_577049 [Mycena sp. CBHHK59/15]
MGDQNHLHTTLSFRPPRLEEDPSYSSDPPTSLSFYDKHVDDRLRLERVVAVPSLVHSLSSVIDDVIQLKADESFEYPRTTKGDDIVHPTRRAYICSVNPFSTATEVAKFYEESTAAFCHPVASAFLVDPFAWLSFFIFNDGNYRLKYGTKMGNFSPFLREGFSLDVRHVGEKITVFKEQFQAYDADTQRTLTGLVHQFPSLGTWQFYCPSPDAETLLRDMGRVASSSSFTPRLCGPVGFPSKPSSRTRPLDATNTPWNIPPANASSAPNPVGSENPWTIPPRRSERLKGVHAPVEASSEPKERPLRRQRLLPTGAVNGILSSKKRRPCSGKAHHFLTDDFIQHGWNQSVRDDTTLIVFSNGNYERIGVRHRATQTLYLSDLIDVTECKDPAYGKLHIGLYMSAFRDAVDRWTQLQDMEESPTDKATPANTHAQKRGAEIAEPDTPSKRRRPSPPAGDEGPDRVFAETASRHLALVRISHGIYESTVPAAFSRSRPSLLGTYTGPETVPRLKQTYLPAEYFTLVLTSEAGEGAVGIVHGATIEVMTEEGELLTQDVVVKLAFSSEQQAALQHEYSIYYHLAAADVKGIPVVLGLFEDVESSVTALVMTHCGVNLWYSRRLEDDHNVKVSPEEKAAFLAIMDNIHRAGVRHLDLRPQNLLLNDAGEATIIDFDKAVLNPTKRGCKRESARLKNLLEGHFIDREGLKTPPENGDV